MALQLRERQTSAVDVLQLSVEESLQRRIRGEFCEMPGMRLTADQAQRLWSLDRDTCVRLLNALVEAQFLQVDQHGGYARSHSGY